MQPYLIQTTAQQVDFYSSFRLPYEPQGMHLLARTELREALAGLPQNAASCLSATLSSQVTQGYDVENVLLYNVGCHHLKRLSLRGLEFRLLSAPDCGNPHGFQYHHRYQMTEAQNERTLPALMSFDLGHADTRLKPHLAWWELVRRLPASMPVITGKFRLCIRLISHRPSPGLSLIVKPLVDGIVSALHFTETAVTDLAVRRLADKLNAPSAEVFARLTCRESKILGMREGLIRRTAGFVAWNPQDENCVQASLRWQTPAEAGREPGITVGIQQV